MTPLLGSPHRSFLLTFCSLVDPNRWTVHDLGTYPNATGYNEGNDEPMPVEEAGNMLWLVGRQAPSKPNLTDRLLFPAG